MISLAVITNTIGIFVGSMIILAAVLIGAGG